MIILKSLLQACFTIWTGRSTITRLFVKVFSKENVSDELTTLDCQRKPTPNGDIWEAITTNLPSSNLWYIYDFHIEVDGTFKHVKDEVFRELRPQNKVLCDVLTHPEHNLLTSDMFEGMKYYLQCFIDCFRETNPLESVLNDLEHLWEYSPRQFTLDNVEFIQEWTEKLLKTYSEEGKATSKKLIFAAVVHGLISPFVAADARRTTSLSKNHFRSIRDLLGQISRLDVTTWAIPHLQMTGIVVLRSLKELNWLTLVAYVGNLYTIDELLKPETLAINEHKLSVESVLNTIIPRMYVTFNADQQTLKLLLMKIPTARGYDESEKQQLSEIVRGKLEHLVLSTVAETSTTSTCDLQSRKVM